MVTAVLIYNMDNPDDVIKHQRALKADTLQAKIDTYYDVVLRNRIKHSDFPLEVDTMIRKLSEELNDHFKECYSED